jgi:hypothetical protein
LVISVCFIKTMVVKVIDEVENHALDDADWEQSLAYTFREDLSMPGSPERKTIVLPNCNVTPVKRKESSIS